MLSLLLKNDNQAGVLTCCSREEKFKFNNGNDKTEKPLNTKNIDGIKVHFYHSKTYEVRIDISIEYFILLGVINLIVQYCASSSLINSLISEEDLPHLFL